MPSTTNPSANSNKQLNTAESFANPSTCKTSEQKEVTMQDIKIGDEDNQNILIREFESDLVIQLRTSENEENCV